MATGNRRRPALHDAHALLCRLLRAAIPLRCVGCGLDAASAGICDHCLRALPWIANACRKCALPLSADGLQCGACLARPPRWDAARCAWRYQFPVPGMLHQFKFARQVATGRVLARLYARWLASVCFAPPDMLVPVPLHWRRRARRHFNQASEIAAALSCRLQIPVVKACRRRRATPAQSGLPAAARRRNLRGAFSVVSPVAGARIAVVDDVLTTGTTAAEMSRVLRRAGATRIEIWALARTDR